MNVYISNPERKKERTDSDANDREIYVAGLSRFATKGDLETLFKTVRAHDSQDAVDANHLQQYGVVKEVRMALDDNGRPKGFAFVEFEQEVNQYFRDSMDHVVDSWVHLARCSRGSKCQ